MKSGRIQGGRGTLLIDNRLGDQVLRVPIPGGGVLVVGVGEVAEMATLTCSHCSVVVALNPMRTRDRAHCFRCNRYICGRPGCRDQCNPIEEMIELAARFPDQPWALRGADGEPLFDQKLKDKERIY